jgi:hypothetical protein
MDFQDESLTGLVAATINSDGQMIVVNRYKQAKQGAVSFTPPAISTFRQDNPRSQRVRMSCHRLQSYQSIDTGESGGAASVITMSQPANQFQIQFQQFD